MWRYWQMQRFFRSSGVANYCLVCSRYKLIPRPRQFNNTHLISQTSPIWPGGCPRGRGKIFISLCSWCVWILWGWHVVCDNFKIQIWKRWNDSDTTCVFYGQFTVVLGVLTSFLRSLQNPMPISSASASAGNVRYITHFKVKGRLDIKGRWASTRIRRVLFSVVWKKVFNF